MSYALLPAISGTKTSFFIDYLLCVRTLPTINTVQLSMIKDVTECIQCVELPV